MKPKDLIMVIFFLLSAILSVNAQNKLKKVGKDTLFFYSDYSYLKKKVSDFGMAYVLKENDNNDSNLVFMLEEVKSVKGNGLLNFKKFLKSPQFYNHQNSFHKQNKIFNRFSESVIIFIDTTDKGTSKFYKASVVLEID